MSGARRIPTIAVAACDHGEWFLRIATASGADTSGITNWRQIAYPPIEEYALREVETLRSNYDEALDEGELGAAWAEAEAALPEGWRLHLTRRPEGSLFATASNREGASAASYAQPTPAAALRALAAKLREPGA